MIIYMLLNYKSNTYIMNKFTLNQLRADILEHIDLPISILNGSTFWRDQWIDWILIQMIGKDYFDLYNKHK